eukprot:1401228-Rhodomonas_salina.3
MSGTDVDVQQCRLVLSATRSLVLNEAYGAMLSCYQAGSYSLEAAVWDADPALAVMTGPMPPFFKALFQCPLFQ